ncbi:DegT/DnrJ/EryC1/StrS family aminotransferase [Lysinimonas soli]|uniref:DegT/DnrJ/EryC1/StrS family aminotransferase n=1 Tax=Lysinimonas soli TaxID=1074233 RepID=A0ABW0NSJ1_9MICO
MSDSHSPALPLATSTWDEDEYAALQRVIASGRFTMGPAVRKFELEFADHFGARYAVMVNSGSSANLVAVAAAVINPDMDLNPGDEVIVPAVSWATTYYPLTQHGLTLKFVDVDIDTLNIDLDAVEAAVGPRTKAVLAVNLLGNPVDFTRLVEICRQHSLLLIEDNCESMGATLQGRAAGTFGVLGTFSSFFSHHISTMEGGMVLTDDEYLYQAMVSTRAHGWTRELPDDNLVYPKSGDAFEDLFRFVLPGYNVRPLEMSGALGTEQLKKLPAIVAGRRANAVDFITRFSGRDELRVQKETGDSSWFGFSLVLEGRLAGRRKDVVAAFTAAGIESRPIVTGNFTRNPVLKHLKHVPLPPLPNADKVHDDGLFIGNHHYPVADKFALVDEALAEVR